MSIKEHGVIQPIIVRRVNDKYEIIAGERRYKASALAGLTKIPAIIRELDDKESSKVALLENLQRKNLNPIEEAKTYQKILEIDEMTQEELAKTMGKSQSSVANKLRLLSLSDEIQQALLQDKISERHARTLLNVKDPKEQQDLLNEIINTKMTVRQLESKIKKEQPPNESLIQDTMISNPSLENIEKKDSTPILKQDNYISSNPLTPSFLIGAETQKEEPLLISSTGENLMNTKEEPELLINEEFSDKEKETSSQKFINFGEIDDTEDEESYQVNDGMLLGNVATTNDSSIDVHDLQDNIQNFSLPKKEASSADLDSLLRINTDPLPSNAPNSGENNNLKFFSPAQEALKESEKEEDSSGDYFKAPDLINVDIPGEVATTPTNNVSLSQATYDSKNENQSVPSINFNPNHSIQDSVEMIREVIKKIEANGLKVDSDEMNLENSYQVIIKIDKE